MSIIPTKSTLVSQNDRNYSISWYNKNGKLSHPYINNRLTLKITIIQKNYTFHIHYWTIKIKTLNNADSLSISVPEEKVTAILNGHIWSAKSVIRTKEYIVILIPVLEGYKMNINDQIQIVIPKLLLPNVLGTADLSIIETFMNHDRMINFKVFKHKQLFALEDLIVYPSFGLNPTPVETVGLGKAFKLNWKMNNSYGSIITLSWKGILYVLPDDNNPPQIIKQDIDVSYLGESNVIQTIQYPSLMISKKGLVIYDDITFVLTSITVSAGGSSPTIIKLTKFLKCEKNTQV